MSDVDSTLQSLHSFLQHNETKVSSGGQVTSFSHDSGSGPVLVLVHGYPQSSYMWRHIVPLVKDKISLFIPELPGYGVSSLPPQADKRTVGNLLIEAVQSVFGASRRLIWCGHDRGGRVGHRLLVDNDPKHNIQSAILLDIVPTAEQWRAFANSRASVAYYHWPFLAIPTAPHLIERMGGREYALDGLERAKGSNEEGVAKFSADGAVELYAHLFNKPETISGACADYMAGATVDVDEQAKDQEAGRKIQAPTLIVYSASNLGRMHDVESLWPKWTDGELRHVGITGGYGHYLPEECPDQIAKLISDWMDRSDG